MPSYIHAIRDSQRIAADIDKRDVDDIPRRTLLSRRTVLSRLAGGLLLLTGCRSESSDPQGDATQTGGNVPLKIVTTCGMVTDIVSVVAGPRGDVQGLIGEGADPHLFVAGSGDVKRLMQADVVFYSGLMLEGRIADDLARISRQGKQVYAVTEGIDKALLREPPEFEGHWDPHVWMDPALWSRAVDLVATALSEVAPAHADEFSQRAADYRRQLDELQAYAARVIGTIPESQRYLVTAHDAFGYFARAYGLEVKAIQGISTESQAGIADVNRLVNFIVEHRIPAIFVESSVSRKNIEAVVEGCARQNHEVTIGAELFSDAMGAPGTYEGTYLGMIDHNATHIARALGGEAPATGWQGKLAAE